MNQRLLGLSGAGKVCPDNGSPFADLRAVSADSPKFGVANAGTWKPREGLDRALSWLESRPLRRRGSGSVAGAQSLDSISLLPAQPDNSVPGHRPTNGTFSRLRTLVVSVSSLRSVSRFFCFCSTLQRRFVECGLGTSRCVSGDFNLCRQHGPAENARRVAGRTADPRNGSHRRVLRRCNFQFHIAGCNPHLESRRGAPVRLHGTGGRGALHLSTRWAGTPRGG